MRGDRLFFGLLLGMGGAITINRVGLAQAVPSNILPDATLGAERSRVITVPGRPIETIQGGAQRGQNLFHSFREFNVGTGQGAYFVIPNATIRNVLTRVTGGNESKILGTIGTVSPRTFSPREVRVPNVNLFLINPNGIVFGPNASLDVGASFFATTASGVQLGDSVFSATQPERPADVLTIDPSAFLFGSATPGRIEVRSRNTRVNFGNPTLGLQVPDGKTLLLLGGDIKIDKGFLVAFGGQVELGAIFGSGQIRLTENARLQVPDRVQRADVSLLDAEIGVDLDQGGDVGITARNIALLDGSLVSAGIASSSGAVGNQAGDIRLDATGEVRLERASQILNIVDQNAIGNSGNLIIKANSLIVTNGSQLSTSTRGQGDAGNIQITASDQVLFQGTSEDGRFISGALSNVQSGAEGNGGNVVITTPVLKVQSGAQLSSSTSGKGNAGNIQITASDQVLFQGTSADGRFGSGALSNAQSNGDGKGGRVKSGNVVILAPVLKVLDGAGLSTSTFGKSNAGNVQITASDRVLFQGSSQDERLVSAALSRVELGAEGNGGNVEITVPILEVRDGTQLTSSTRGKGDAGNVQIIASDRVLFQGRSPNGLFSSSAVSSVESKGEGNGGNVEVIAPILEVRDGAGLNASSVGKGNAGNIRITASDRVLFQGRSADGLFASAALSSVELGGKGTGGNLEITAPVLEVRDGAGLSASSRGKGDAGNVQIIASDRIMLDGFNPNTGRSSSIRADNGNPNTLSIGTGKGGDVILTTPQLTLSNGAVIDARTANDKLGGDITLNLVQLSLLSGGQILTTSNGSGSAGNLNLTASNQVLISGTDPTYANRRAQFGTAVSPISDNSGIYARAINAGAAGNLNLTTPRLTLDQQGRIDAESSSIDGGNINLTVPDLLLLRNGSQISATAGTSQASGNGGNIDINARFLIAIPKENSDITANAFTGDGGKININTQGIFGLKQQPKLTPQSDITASSDRGGITGTILLNTPDNSTLQNNLNQLSNNQIDTNKLLAQTCLIRQDQPQGTFYITGTGGIPNRPNDPALSTYPTNTIQPTTQTAQKPWKLGDPIIEPQGFYKLANGRLVMSRECQSP